jgi:hypothetical protein
MNGLQPLSGRVSACLGLVSLVLVGGVTVVMAQGARPLRRRPTEWRYWATFSPCTGTVMTAPSEWRLRGSTATGRPIFSHPSRLASA